MSDQEMQLIPANRYVGQPYYERLAKKDQKAVDVATQKVGQLAFAAMSSRLKTGKYLIVIRKILKGDFRKHIRAINLRERTAYRIIEDYLATEKLVPAQTLPVVLALNYDFAKPSYRGVLKQLPAPDSSDPAVVAPWCTAIEERHRAKMKVRMGRNGNGHDHDGAMEILGPESDPDELLKESFRFARIRIHRLPRKGAGWKTAREKWVTRLSGFLMTEAGVEDAQAVTPLVPSEDFLRGRGRPATKEEVN